MKTRTVLMVLIVAAALMMASAASHSDARATTVSSMMSGGQYMLTIQSPPVTQPTGYRLVDAATTADPAAGCCCKDYVPCVLKK